MELEVNGRSKDETAHIGPMMLTPPISDDYWMFRVKLDNGQAVLGFLKFRTIGIGFAVEEDWNTNLPYTCPETEIYDHIEHNKKPSDATRDEVIVAIALIQDAARAYFSVGINQ